MSTLHSDRMLLANVIARNAAIDPSGTFAKIPAGTKYTDGFVDVTKAEFNHAVNYTASLIRAEFGVSRSFETLAYIGPSDLRYSIMAVACMKVGYKVFLPSPRNSIEAHVALLKKLECTKLVVTAPQSPCIPPILNELQLRTMSLPSLQELLLVKAVEEQPYDLSFEEARSHPAFVLHTSGSTGIPKPLVFTNDFISKVVGASVLSAPVGFTDIDSYFKSGRFFMTLPSFHIAGLAFSLIISAYHGSIPVYALPGPPPNAESLVEALSHTDVDWAFVPPTAIDEFSKSASLLDSLTSRCKYLFFTGGSVPKQAGDIVSQRLPIWQVLGSSECGSLPLVYPTSDYTPQEDWQYLQLNPKLKSEMRLRLDDLYELVIVRDEDTEGFQPVFAHFTEATEYETRDLFKPHPSKPGLWAHQSRIDDVIVFLNGEKTNPVTYEAEIVAHPEVKAALVIGAQRVEAALLIELVADKQLSEEDRLKFIDNIWPTVEKANRATPAHARISKDKILLVDPNIPMLRAGKGTVQRSATLALYAGEIDAIYQQDSAPRGTDATPSTRDTIRATIRDLIAETLALDDVDFFQLGLDSLGALKIQRGLKTRLPELVLSLNTIYTNPSVNGLVQALTNPSKAIGQTGQDGISQLLDKYQRSIEAFKPMKTLRASHAADEGMVILLTGSTGALGSYILNELLSQHKARHIYCFNRTSNAKDRQLKNHQNRKLTEEFAPDRVTFLTGDLHSPNFGLSDGEYDELTSKVTHVIHNAWPVNFNLPLTEFTDSLVGVVNLVRFLAGSQRDARVLFCSSISSVTSYNVPVVPEVVISDLTAPAGTGYGQSKYLAERLLDHAAKVLGVRSAFVRIGQVAGAARTASGWNRQEWLPSLITSSAWLGAIPEAIGNGSGETIDWIPMDFLATVLVELALGSDGTDGAAKQGASVFHVVHPRPVKWSYLLPHAKATLEALRPSQGEIAVVPYTEWYSLLKAKSEKSHDKGGLDPLTIAKANPASKLLDFYESLQYQGEGGLQTALAMENTLKVSGTLRDLEPLRVQWLEGWITEWMEV